MKLQINLGIGTVLKWAVPKFRPTCCQPSSFPRSINI